LEKTETKHHFLGKKKRREWLIGGSFVLPSLLVLLLMAAYPMIQVIVFSFSDVRMATFKTTFNGIDNFKYVFSRPELWQILKQTVIWTVASLSLRIIIGFGAALMLDSGLKGRTIFRVTTLIPWVVPSIVASNTWRFIYNPDIGLINSYMRRLFPDFLVIWLGDAKLALGSVIATYVWTGFPFIMLMVMAGLQGIPRDYKEAASIDGANAVQRFIHVTLPNLKNIMAIIIVLELISGFNAFDLLYTMTAGGPGIMTEIFGLMIYRYAFTNFQYGRASALSLLLLGIMIVFFLIYVPVAAKGRGKKHEY
jgi:multiple sugar transport system permease protein